MTQSAIIKSCIECLFSNYDNRNSMAGVSVPHCFHPAFPRDLGEPGALISGTTILDGCPIVHEVDGIRFVVHPAASGAVRENCKEETESVKKLIVTITGPVAEGKTTLAILLRNYLRSIGLRAVIEGDSTVERFDKEGQILNMTRLQPMEVIIRQVTTNRTEESE